MVQAGKGPCCANCRNDPGGMKCSYSGCEKVKRLYGLL